MCRSRVLVALLAAVLSLGMAACTKPNMALNDEESNAARISAEDERKTAAEEIARLQAEQGQQTEESKPGEQQVVDDAARGAEEDYVKLRATAEEEGLTVLEGTVHIMGGTELCDYEGVDPNMNGDADDVARCTYVILVLDEMTHVSGMGGDGSPRDGDADHVGIGRDMPMFDFVENTADQWMGMEGQRICVAGSVAFQSDVSLPFAPRMYDARLLYVV